jgi:hypothetical protein
MLDLMFLGSRAPWGRSEDRCDGDGSEADGAKPPVKPGPMLPVLGVLVFLDTSALVIPPSSGLRINQARRWPGRFCPAYRIGFAPWIGGGAVVERAVFSGLVNRKFFIHWLWTRGTAGFRLGRALELGTLGRGWHWVTAR